jgi:hypothetical protein
MIYRGQPSSHRTQSQTDHLNHIQAALLRDEATRQLCKGTAHLVHQSYLMAKWES